LKALKKAQKKEQPYVKEKAKKEPAPTSFEYEFTIENSGARKVAVAGEFNSWRPSLNLTK